MTDIRDFITNLYDQTVRESGGAMSAAEVREALRPAVRAWIAEQPRDLDADTEAALKDQLPVIRDVRRKELRKAIEYVMDYWANPNDAAHLDMLLDAAYPLGTDDGASKTLRYWTVEDFDNAAQRRLDDAKKQNDSAAEFRAAVRRVAEYMTGLGASLFGDTVRGSAAA